MLQAGWFGTAPLVVGRISDPSGPDNAIGYGAYVYAHEARASLARHRWYDPLLGRWWQRDPAGYADGMSLYEYVRSGPIGGWDPYGLITIGEAAHVVGAFFVGAGEGFGATVKGAGNAVKEVAFTAYDIGGGVVDTAATLAGYNTGFEPISAAGQQYMQGGSWGETAWDMAELSGTGLRSGLTLGTYDLAKGVCDYAETGDVQALGNAAGGVALSNGLGAGAQLAHMRTIASGGRLGNLSTRSHVKQVAREMERRGWQITGGGGRAPEEYIAGLGGGRRGSAYPDITATKNGRTLRVNTVDTWADGVTLTKREATNAAKIRRLRPKDHLLTIPKPKD